MKPRNLLFLFLFFLTACSGGATKTSTPIDQQLYENLITNLKQGEFIKIATHFKTKDEVVAYMKKNEADVTIMGDFEEDGIIYDDYTPVSKSYFIGFSILYDSATRNLQEIGVGLSDPLGLQAETLIKQARHSLSMEAESPFLSKTAYYFGYVPINEKRLEITLEKTVSPKKSLYSLVYQLEKQKN